MKLQAVNCEDWNADGGAHLTMGAAVNISLNGMVRVAFLRDQRSRMINDFNSGVAVIFPCEIQPYHLVKLIKAEQGIHVWLKPLIQRLYNRSATQWRVASLPAMSTCISAGVCTAGLVRAWLISSMPCSHHVVIISAVIST